MQIERANHPASDSIGHLLEFLAPGIVHALGNSLFAIRGAAHVLGAADVPNPDTGKIVADAVEDGVETLDALRFLTESRPATRQPALTVLRALVNVLRVPLRERGLGIRMDEASVPGTVKPDPSTVARSVCECVDAMSRDLPEGLDATLVLGQDADGLFVRAESASDCLPFPLDLRATRDRVRDRAAGYGASDVSCQGCELRLRV